MNTVQERIEAAFEQRAEISPSRVPAELQRDLTEVIQKIDQGEYRVAEKKNGTWVVNEWLKKAVLLSFRTQDNHVMNGGETRFFDKVDSKFIGYDDARFRAEGMRVVPPAMVRKGAYIGRNVVL